MIMPKNMEYMYKKDNKAAMPKKGKKGASSFGAFMKKGKKGKKAK